MKREENEEREKETKKEPSFVSIIKFKTRTESNGFIWKKEKKKIKNRMLRYNITLLMNHSYVSVSYVG